MGRVHTKQAAGGKRNYFVVLDCLNRHHHVIKKRSRKKKMKDQKRPVIWVDSFCMSLFCKVNTLHRKSRVRQ